MTGNGSIMLTITSLPVMSGVLLIYDGADRMHLIAQVCRLPCINH